MNEKMLKKQLWYSRITMLCSIGILCAVIVVGAVCVPKFTQMADKVTEKMDEIDTETINAFMAQSTETLEDLDIDAVNSSITELKEAAETLQKVLNPLSSLFGSKD